MKQACLQHISAAVSIQVHRACQNLVVCLHTGSLNADDSSAVGDLPPNIESISWAYSTRSIYGWGNTGNEQKATAGWLAALPVFEPHWQVHMSCCAMPCTAALYILRCHVLC